MTAPAKIYLFTDRYPYGRGETFVGGELCSQAAKKADITVFPARKAPGKRELPEGVRMSSVLSDAPAMRKARTALYALFSKHLWKLPFSARRPKNFRQWRNALGGLYRAYLTFLTVKAHRAFFSQADVFYSYWLDNTATGLALAKTRLKHFGSKPLVCRAHGYDVFEEERGIFFPARLFALEHIDRIFPVSRAGETYLKARYPHYADKMECRHLGVKNRPCPPRDLCGDRLRFVSCANVIALKRIGLTADFLKRYATTHPGTKMQWTHFGTGPLLETMRHAASENVPDNLHIAFEGAVPNSEILRRYMEGAFDIFVSLSRSEGMPVSAIEAMSCGIVPVCTDAGGTRDAVDDSTGALLPVDPTYGLFEQALEHLLENYSELSASAIARQRNDFSAEGNYSDFYRQFRISAG